METNVALVAAVRFFGIEETNGCLVFVTDGVQYEEMFPLLHAQELVKSYLSEGCSDPVIAKRLSEYWKNDA
ncbi:MAG: hypothetical protein EOP49_14810 [Sphingobacteriales bacterium]|nr:MAG: hypothetical protein EOP49_14810 [Sphingobacteriales bacterium]